MSIRAIVRRSLPFVFTLTFAGPALAENAGYRDMLARHSDAHTATAMASPKGYRGVYARLEQVPAARAAVGASRGYRDVLVRFARLDGAGRM